jgi:hypothetical protein
VSFLDAVRRHDDVELALPGVMVSHLEGPQFRPPANRTPHS